MARGPKKQRLNLFLMKPGVTIEQTVRGDVDGLTRTVIKQDYNFSGIIVAKGAHAIPPRWMQFVQTGSEQPLGVLLNQSASGLIVLQARERVFAIAFGFARHWIDESSIVRRFGMKVTLNVVHPDRIRSVDREEFDTIQRKTRSQTSVRSSIDNFGLNVQRDLVRSVTGEPENQDFAAHVTGADNLILSAPLTFGQLGEKCADALAQYNNVRYRDRYPWVDNFNRINDPTHIASLEANLAEALRSGAYENTFLTPPDTLDQQHHRGFRYPGERNNSDLHPDLRMEDFLAKVDPRTVTVESLKKWRIREFSVDDNIPSREFAVHEAIIYEVMLDTKLYVLSFGEWFEVAHDHVLAVNNQIAQIRNHPELRLVDANAHENEGEYNRRAALASNGTFALLDADPVIYGGGRSSIEICDLLSTDRVFVHVKAKTKSSTLSHLFAQGLNSAQAFRDVRFRELAINKCPSSHRNIFEGEPRASDFTITFAIITQAAGDIRDALPFFSKQSLANATSVLMNMGYQVRLQKIAIAHPA